MPVVYDFKDLAHFKTRREIEAFRATLKNNTRLKNALFIHLN